MTVLISCHSQHLQAATQTVKMGHSVTLSADPGGRANLVSYSMHSAKFPPHNEMFFKSSPSR